MQTDHVDKCRLEFGESVYWEVTRDEARTVQSIPGRLVVDAVFRTGQEQRLGMWRGLPITTERT